MAVKDRTTLKASADSLLANNTSAAISPEDVRETIKDLADSAVFYNENNQKANVRVATTGAGTLATGFENGDTIDGVVLATGNRILIKDQAAPAENGIYTVNASGAPTRATDFNSSDNVKLGAQVYVEAGTTNAGKYFYLSSPTGTITVGTSSLVFSNLQVTLSGGVTHNNTSTYNTVKIKIIEMGDWNMDTSSNKTVAHGLTLAKIRQVACLIRSDSDAFRYPLEYEGGTGAPGGTYRIDATNVDMDRTASGPFDGVGYDSTSYNRGWVTITYEDTV